MGGGADGLEELGGDRFDVLRRLGSGGMGVVYEAFDRQRRARVAIKTLRDLDAHSLYRFKQEFRSLAELDHPNLIRLGELFCHDGRWFFTMELVEGVDFLAWTRPDAPRSDDAETQVSPATIQATAKTDPDLLARLIGAQRPALFDEPRLRASLGQLALAAQALHDAHMVHRDIKPSNILVDGHGRAVLLDFGLVADLAAERALSEAETVGTPLYMAPEQGLAKPVGPAADWYSIGAVMYEVLTGQPPFVGAPMAVLIEKQRHEPRPPRALVPSVPAELDALCSELLRFDPVARPGAVEVLERLGVRPRSSPAPTPAPSQSVRFVGRARELGELRAAFDETSGGRARAVFLHGESGLGKSALVRYFTRALEADDSPALVLAGRCYERESVPFNAFDGIIDALSRHLSLLDTRHARLLLPPDTDVLARVFPVLRRVRALDQEPAGRRVLDPRQLRARGFAALRQLLARLAEQQPLVLFVDDFQWADADSRALLAELCADPDPPALLFIGAMRPLAGGESSPALDAARAQRSARHLHLERLSPAESRELASALLGAAAPSSEAAHLAVEGAGHPLFIQELARHQAAAGTPHASIRLDEALWSRVARLDESARLLLEVIAVAAAPIDPRLAAQAAGVDAGDFLRQLRAAHLVRALHRGADEVETYHNRVREAVLAHLDEDTLRRHHARLADALESEGSTHPRVLVEHLIAADLTERAAEQAERAARRAFEALAFDQAAELYFITLRLGRHDQAERRRLCLSLAEALASAGRGAEAADAFLAGADGADATLRFDCQRRAAELLLGHGHVERGQEVLGQVLGEIGERLPGSPRRALASLLWQRARLRLRGLAWTEREPAEVDARRLTRLDVYQTVAIAMGMSDSLVGAAYQARGLGLALRTGERRRVGRAIAFEAIYQGTQGGRSIARGRALAAEASRIAARLGDPYLTAVAAAATGIVNLYAGQFRVGTAQLGEAEVRLRDETTGTALELANARFFRLLGLRYLGEYAELRRAFQTQLHDARRRSDLFTETTMVRAFNVVWLAADQPDEAERVLEGKSWAAPGGRYHVQHWYELLARVEIALYRGHAAATVDALAPGFAALERSLLTRIQMIRSAAGWMGARLELAAAEESGATPARSVDKRIARLERERLPYIDVWTNLLGGALAARRGRRDEALGRLDVVARLAREQDRRFYAAAADRRRGELTGGPDGAALVAAADQWMREQGIADPARFTQVVAPGFRRG